MTELTGPAVEKALASMADDLVRRTPVRRLWVFRLRGLTPQILTAAARSVGVPILPGKEVLLWHDLAIASGEQWKGMRTFCAHQLGADPDELERPDISAQPYFRRWLEQRRAIEACERQTKHAEIQGTESCRCGHTHYSKNGRRRSAIEGGFRG